MSKATVTAALRKPIHIRYKDALAELAKIADEDEHDEVAAYLFDELMSDRHSAYAEAGDVFATIHDAELRKELATEHIDDEAPLLIASKHGVPNLAEVLVAAGADVNEKSGYEGSTALHGAAGTHAYDVDLVKMLIAAGADLDATNDDDETPFQVAKYALDVASVGDKPRLREILKLLAGQQGGGRRRRTIKRKKSRKSQTRRRRRS